MSHFDNIPPNTYDTRACFSFLERWWHVPAALHTFQSLLKPSNVSCPAHSPESSYPLVPTVSTPGAFFDRPM